MQKIFGSDFWLGILLRREGITIAHSIIIVDHLGKGSSLPFCIKSGKRHSSEKKRVTNQIQERELFLLEQDLRMLDGSDFWLESSSAEEGLHLRTV